MLSKLLHYQPANPSLWQGRQDTVQDERFFQKIDFVEDESLLLDANKKTVFLGFASDTGISRNLGRPGAKMGPDQIKMQLAKLPCATKNRYIDLGNIVCENDDLEAAQAEFSDLVSFCHANGHKTIAFGGGHEIAWAHYKGLAQQYPKLGIINFDAHFDLRPYQKGHLGTSGTPFSQMAVYCEENNRVFNYCCLGIQPCGNTSSLFHTAKDLHVKYLLAADLYQQSLAWQMAFIDDVLLHLDRVYLTICLDVFAECFAPGVSAPQALGISPWHALPLLKYIIQSGKVVGFDIAELSPPLDQDQKTARLAALITAELINTN